jgi:hypothetical protein
MKRKLTLEKWILRIVDREDVGRGSNPECGEIME